MDIKLKRVNGDIITTGEYDSIRKCAEVNKANLAGANLTGANLAGADLYDEDDE